MRIIYHPAPGPGSDGRPRPVAPIELIPDLAFVLDWIRRRLGLAKQPSFDPPAFRYEILPTPVSDEPETSTSLSSDELRAEGPSEEEQNNRLEG